MNCPTGNNNSTIAIEHADMYIVTLDGTIKCIVAVSGVENKYDPDYFNEDNIYPVVWPKHLWDYDEAKQLIYNKILTEGPLL
jgi:hypothetical protein